jgi:hypothetical protein
MVTAAAAVLGACAAGGATYLATTASERSEDRRQEKLLDEQARGAARVLLNELAGAGVYGSLVADRDEWVQMDGLDSRVEIDQEKLQLVFARLSPEEYRSVIKALQMSGVVDPIAQEVGEGDPLGDSGRSLVEDAIESYKEAEDALEVTADLASR